MFDFQKIKQQIDFEYEYGIREFEITGGEPSEYTQLRNVCEYIIEKDSSCKLCIITNGGLYNSDVWDLIDEVLISYHLGRNTNSYDKTMFPLGSTYDKVKKTIDKANENNVFVRTNTVVGTFNAAYLDTIVDDLIEFNPRIVNFLPVNIFDEAKDMVSCIDYSMFRDCIKHAIDKLNANIDTQIFVRYMPFCCMAGYEKYIVGTLQHIYDKHDWNVELDGVDILDKAANKEKSLAKLGSYGSTSIATALQIRKNSYEKTLKCVACKYNILCDGVEKTEDKSLLKYIEPNNGKLIKNILYFLNS